MITRRNLIIAGIGAAPLFGASDFWNKKKPSEWSEKEVQTLLTRSPWAKEASAEFNMEGFGGPGGMGGPPPGGDMGPPGGGMGGPPGMGGGMPEMHPTVRWESAAPVRAAAKSAGEEPPVNTYILSLSGMPMMGGRRRRPDGAEAVGPGPEGGMRRPDPTAMQARMKEATRLERKGKDPIAPTKIETKDSDDSRSTWFYFEGGGQPIDGSDKEVTFVTRMGPMEIRAKFNLKDMTYQGKLAL